MAIKIHTEADVAQKPNPGWYDGVDPISQKHEPPPKAESSWSQETQDMIDEIVKETVDSVNAKILQKHKERLAYNAAYQRELRTIKRQGLNMTVKQYRESKMHNWDREGVCKDCGCNVDSRVDPCHGVSRDG